MSTVSTFKNYEIVDPIVRALYLNLKPQKSDMDGFHKHHSMGIVSATTLVSSTSHKLSHTKLPC